jgi:hypothetical protein
MKFTLLYEGELPSSGNSSKKVRKKWEIREHFDPQLRELWRVHPALLLATRNSIVPQTGGFWMIDTHHSDQTAPSTRAMGPNDIDLCAEINRGGRRFYPLVRETFGLTCTLEILFLRRENPGRVYQGGDLDNRIKTLLDALSIPQVDQIVADATIADPIFCLLEDDSKIAGLTVVSERLLSSSQAPQSHVNLIIRVNVQVTQARSYNLAFVGD